jgi:hypothetical protein
MAANADINIIDLGDGWVAIDYNTVAGPNISAFALKISVDAGTITDVCDYHVGESITGSKGYGIFPSNIDINQTTGVVNAYNGPIAPNTAPGAAGTGIDTNSIVGEFGALYEDGNQPAKTGRLCVVGVSESCTLTVDAEATRGNVVKEDATEETFTNLPTSLAISTCDTSDTYGWLRLRSDATRPGFTTPDGFVGFDDLNLVIYFYDTNESDCATTWPSDPNLCRRASFCGPGFNPTKDDLIGFDELNSIIYFYDQNVCL